MFSIGEWKFDPERNRLQRPGKTVRLQPLAAKLLEHLAARPGKVFSLRELGESVWRARVVGDGAIYRSVSELRRALGDDREYPTYIETIRKRGYRLVAPVKQPDKPLVHDATESPQPFDTAGKIRIAVLPFDDLSEGRTSEHLADGVSEALIHQLAQIRELEVIARTSSFALRNTVADVREIGSKLGVAFILEGSVQRSDGAVRITAQLVDAVTGTHLFSRLFDRRKEDTFAIQDEIAANVVDALRINLIDGVVALGRNAAGTRNFDAYEEYLKGRRELSVASHESLSLAAAHFEKSLAMDSGYNEARLALADTHDAMMRVGMAFCADNFRRKETIALDVLRRDPDSARAMMHLAWVDFALNFPTGSGDAERLFRRAEEVAPGDPALVWAYAYFLNFNARAERALALIKKGLSLDPLSVELLTAAAGLGELKYAERLRRTYPENPAGWGVQAEVHVAEDRLAAAFKLFQIAEEKDPQNPDFPAWSAMILMTVGLIDEAEAALHRADTRGPTSSATIAARIALLYKRKDLERAGEMALSVIRAGTQLRAFAHLVWKRAALDYALRSNQAGRFIEAYAALYHAIVYKDQGVTEATRRLNEPAVRSTIDFWFKLDIVPALRAIGRYELAEEIVANARKFFDASSEQFRSSQTDFDLLVLSGRFDDAVDTFESSLEINKQECPTAHVDVDSKYFWWLKFGDESVEPLLQHPRFQGVLSKYERWLGTERVSVLST